MFDQLRKKWKVNALQLFLIICTFAIGGSVTGYVARKLMINLGIEKGLPWLIVFILLVSLIWPIAVIIVSFPMGQFQFFVRYIRKIGARFGIVSKSQKSVNQIAIFASGAGSNTGKIIDHFRNHSSFRIALIVTNKANAGVVSVAKEKKIDVLLLDKDRFFEGDGYVDELKSRGITWIVLAGFLWKLPPGLIRAYNKKIINIHPALLPAYGGKGMYGMHVHKAVILNQETESGISIHFVDDLYDHGPVIFQAKCVVDPDDTPDSLAQKIHRLEYRYYPTTIEKIITGAQTTKSF